MQERSINLTFHGIGEPALAIDSNERRYWVGCDEFVTVLDAAAQRGDVRISFDDGNASDVQYALPALSARGLRASFFVVAGRLGTPGYLDAGDLHALTAAGMTIGCHGMRHVAWRRLDDDTLHEELVDAKRILEDVVERPVTAAACPFGSYDRRVLRTLRRSGYGTVYTSDTGTARPDQWLQARNSIRRGDGAQIVERVLASERPAHRALRLRAKQVAKRWR